MQFMKKILNLFLLMGAIVCATFGVGEANTVKQIPEQKEHMALISKASATDKVYLTYASVVTETNADSLYHYSHRSHSSHSSHQSHRSHYSSY